MVKDSKRNNRFFQTIEAAPYIFGLLPLLTFALYSVNGRIQSKYFESILTASGLTLDPVSYTHLDVYKRQLFTSSTTI